MLRKLAPPMNLTVPEVAEAEGISTASLYDWRKQARERGEVLPSRGSAPEQWRSKDKFRVVLETAPMICNLYSVIKRRGVRRSCFGSGLT